MMHVMGCGYSSRNKCIRTYPAPCFCMAPAALLSEEAAAVGMGGLGSGLARRPLVNTQHTPRSMSQEAGPEQPQEGSSCGSTSWGGKSQLVLVGPTCTLGPCRLGH